MKCSEIFERLCEAMPLELAQEWDNSGLLLGRKSKDVKCIVIALDLTNNVVDYAVENNADLVITHHPAIFTSIKNVTDERLLKLSENKMSYIAMHTNYDVAKGCMSDIAADMLGIRNGEPIPPEGFGKYGKLKKKMTVDEIADLVKERFNIPGVMVYGASNVKGKTDKVAILPGSGHDEVQDCINAGVDVYITGDISHHSGIDAREAGICVIDATHYGIEKIFVADMKKRIQEICGKKVKVLCRYEVENGPGYYR